MFGPHDEESLSTDLSESCPAESGPVVLAPQDGDAGHDLRLLADGSCLCVPGKLAHLDTLRGRFFPDSLSSEWHRDEIRDERLSSSDRV